MCICIMKYTYLIIKRTIVRNAYTLMNYAYDFKSKYVIKYITRNTYVNEIKYVRIVLGSKWWVVCMYVDKCSYGSI